MAVGHQTCKKKMLGQTMELETDFIFTYKDLFHYQANNVFSHVIHDRSFH